jgi:hypothetical protein
MKVLPRRFRDESSSRIGSYEAFLDLLTLFCFILMFAAALQVAQPASTGTAQVSAQDAKRGASPGRLPATQVELKVSKEGSIDKLTILDGPARQTFDFELADSHVDFELTSVESSLRGASNICIAVFEDSQPVNPDVVVAIQRWLSYNALSNYQFYFVEPR